MAISGTQVAAASLEPYLERCGYIGELLRRDYTFEQGERLPFVGFANEPADARSACIAVIESAQNSPDVVSPWRRVGAPIVLVCQGTHLHWWKQGNERPQHIESISAGKIAAFFHARRQDFSPEAIYRAKTWGRFDKEYQLTFVDVGLMPIIENEIGQALGGLIARTIGGIKSRLRLDNPSNEQSDWLLKTAFWLVSAKILRDKRVPTFSSVDLTDIQEVFRRVASHYGVSSISIRSGRERDALIEAGDTIRQFSHLGNVTTESLAYVYENTLISAETRSALGTHSTPSYLVDYVVGRLASWIESTPADARNVFEPACGHGAFLVAAMRLLRELLPHGWGTNQEQHAYLQARLHGYEIDRFALEIALLSLTLADIPNPDGWDLRVGDIFVANALEQAASESTVLLSNPPFEDFSRDEKASYELRGVSIQHNNKTAELLFRCLASLPNQASFGIVVPQGILHSRKASDVRETLLREFEIREICLFPDNTFTFSDMESAVIIGRKKRGVVPKNVAIDYRIVRRHDADQFRLDYGVSVKNRVLQSRFTGSNGWDLRVPELDEIWVACEHLSALSEIADVGQGLQFKGEKLPRGSVTFSRRRFPGGVRGFVAFDRNLGLHDLPTVSWLNLEPRVIRRPGTGTQIGQPQILLNYAPVSRGPWRLKALIDREGHPVTSRFLTVRLVHSWHTLEYAWALCNCPFANAFAYTHSGKRDNLAGMIRALPIPRDNQTGIERVTGLVRDYLALVSVSAKDVSGTSERARALMLKIDSEILRLYDLPPRLERQLLDSFAGWDRLGVPFSFDRYYQADFEPCFSLHEYLSAEYAHSTAGRLREALAERIPGELLRALDEAASAFRE